jgi:hypothetical protein
MTSTNTSPAAGGGARKQSDLGRSITSEDRANQQQIQARAATAIATALDKYADAIRRLGKQTIANIIEIGRHLTEAKKIAGHGNWLPWLDREFGWTDRTALNFMRVFALSLKSETVSDLDLPVGALYLLAAPSTPTEACEAVIKRAEAGEPISTDTVRQAIAKARQQPAKKNRRTIEDFRADIRAKQQSETPEPTSADAAQILDNADAALALDRHACRLENGITRALNELDEADQQRLIERLQTFLSAMKVVSHDGGAVELPSCRVDADAAASAEAMKGKFAAIEQEVKDIDKGGNQTHFEFTSQSIAAPVPVLGDDPGPMPEFLRRVVP